MKEYVVGFAFSKNFNEVLLIKKCKPDWQAGRCNGIGGKVELGETVERAMVREFTEECGILTQEKDWRKYALLECVDGSKVWCFEAVMDISHFGTMTEEQVFIWKISDVMTSQRVIHNLKWLIPLAFQNGVAFTTVRYQEIQ